MLENSVGKSKLIETKTIFSPVSTPQDNCEISASASQTLSTIALKAFSGEEAAEIILLEKEVESLKAEISSNTCRNEISVGYATRQAELERQIIILKAEIKQLLTERCCKRSAELQNAESEINHLQDDNEGLLRLIEQRDEAQKEQEARLRQLSLEHDELRQQLEVKNTNIAKLELSLRQKEDDSEKRKRVRIEERYLELDVDHKKLQLELSNSQQKLQQAVQEMNRMKRKLTELETSNLHFSDLNDDDNLKRLYKDVQRALTHEKCTTKGLREENAQMRGKIEKLNDISKQLRVISEQPTDLALKYRTKEGCYKLGVRNCELLFAELVE